MTNDRAELSDVHARLLRECYGALHQLAAECTVPSVLAAARAALAELHAALEGQALEFEYYSQRWSAGQRSV